MSSNTKKRIISALFIGLLFMFSIFVVRTMFYIIMSAVCFFMMHEWYKMTKTELVCIFIGLILIPIAIYCIILISAIDNVGWFLFSYFVCIWTVDVMALCGGKLIGGTKLAPKISPNKTISGLLCGVLSAVIITNILATIFAHQTDIYYNRINLSLFVVIVAVLAQIGDLFVSIFKRKFEIKDTGSIIPGHGGVLDRFDSIIFTSPVCYFVLYYFI